MRGSDDFRLVIEIGLLDIFCLNKKCKIFLTQRKIPKSTFLFEHNPVFLIKFKIVQLCIVKFTNFVF